MAMEISHIWVGIFGSKETSDYFQDEYTDDGDWVPNKFATDQGETHYDHDWLEVRFDAGSEPVDVRSFVEGHSYSDDYVDEVVEKSRVLGLERINVFVIADKNEFASPRSPTGHDYRLEYLGEFKCNT